MGPTAQRKAYAYSATSAELVNMLAAECCDPARLLELYYWSTDPDYCRLSANSRHCRERPGVRSSGFSRPRKKHGRHTRR